MTAPVQQPPAALREGERRVTAYESWPPVGPQVPGLTASGLGYVREDLVRSAANHEEWQQEATQAGNMQLAQRHGGAANAYRWAAEQLTAYALTPTWSVTE